jgi:hypothetical protein
VSLDCAINLCDSIAIHVVTFGTVVFVVVVCVIVNVALVLWKMM